MNLAWFFSEPLILADSSQKVNMNSEETIFFRRFSQEVLESTMFVDLPAYKAGLAGVLPVKII